MNDIVAYKSSDIEKTVQNMVNDAVDLGKLQARVSKRSKVAVNPYIIKDPGRYEHRRELRGIHEEKIRCAEKLSNGNVISGSMDSTIRLWDANTG